MDTLAALEEVRARFPFDTYVEINSDGILSLAGTVQSHLPAGGSVLDFGSGPCDKTAALQVLGYRCAAYDDLSDTWHNQGDNRQRILNFAHEIGIDFRVATPGDPLPFSSQTFDLVMANDVLEHLHDSPRELILDLVDLLAPMGLLLITVPNAVNIRKRVDVLRGRTNLPDYHDYYWNEGPWRGHVREYTRGDLIDLARFSGLEIVELHGVHHMLRRLSPTARKLHVAACRLFDGWKDSWLLLARRPSNWRPKRQLEGEERQRLLHREAWEALSGQ